MWLALLLSSVTATLPLGSVGVTSSRKSHQAAQLRTQPLQSNVVDTANGLDSIFDDEVTTTTPPMQPPVLLLMSSSKERKVSYTELQSFETVNSTVLPLIDAGLMGPAGIAWDPVNSALYVADPPVKKIMLFHLKVTRCFPTVDGPCNSVFSIHVSGSPVVVVQGVLCSWVSTDKEGNLYYTDQTARSVNRLSSDVLRKLEEGEIEASALQMVSQSEAEALSHVSSASQSGVQSAVGRQRAAEAQEAALDSSTVSLYQADVSKNVGTPAGVCSDGDEVYWANMMGGGQAGSVGVGRVSLEGANFPTSTVASKTPTAYGVITTYSSVLFTDKAQFLYAVAKTGGPVMTVSNAFLAPRGLAWDGDSSVYVADEQGNAVYSLPYGRPAENRPLRLAATIHGPFGLAVVRGTDPAFASALDGYVRGGAQSIGYLSRTLTIVCAAFVGFFVV